MLGAVEECGACLVVFGGGTSVTGALLVPKHEARTVVSLDTSQMVRNPGAQMVHMPGEVVMCRLIYIFLWRDCRDVCDRIGVGVNGKDLE